MTRAHSRAGILVLVNGADWELEGGEGTVVNDGDEVRLRVCGGSGGGGGGGVGDGGYDDDATAAAAPHPSHTPSGRIHIHAPRRMTPLPPFAFSPAA